MYYVDGVQVSATSFGEAFVPGQTSILSEERSNPDGPYRVKIHTFNDLEEYFSFGDRAGTYAREIHSFNQKIELVNQDFNVDQHFASTGEVPEGYEMAIANLTNTLPSKLLGSSGTTPRKALGLLFEDCDSERFRPALAQMPFMLFGYNDRVSVIDRLAVFGLTFIYDKAFYRRHLATIDRLGFGQGLIRMCPGEPFFFLNDRMSSGMFM